MRQSQKLDDVEYLKVILASLSSAPGAADWELALGKANVSSRPKKIQVQPKE